MIDWCLPPQSLILLFLSISNWRQNGFRNPSKSPGTCCFNEVMCGHRRVRARYACASLADSAMCARAPCARARAWPRSILWLLCFSPLVCFLPCFFDPCLAYFNPGITSKHIKASYGIKEKLEFIKIRLKKHVFTLKHKYGRDNKTMLIHRLNVTKGYQNTLNSIQDKP